MTPEEILFMLRSLGHKVTLTPRGTILIGQPPMVPPDLEAAVRANKPAILALLRAETTGLTPDQAAWLPTTRQILAGEFDGAGRSLLESLRIGLRSIPHPLARQALVRLEDAAKPRGPRAP